MKAGKFLLVAGLSLLGCSSGSEHVKPESEVVESKVSPDLRVIINEASRKVRQAVEAGDKQAFSGDVDLFGNEVEKGNGTKSPSKNKCENGKIVAGRERGECLEGDW
jgi:hypothetical protein